MRRITLNLNKSDRIALFPIQLTSTRPLNNIIANGYLSKTMSFPWQLNSITISWIWISVRVKYRFHPFETRRPFFTVLICKIESGTRCLTSAKNNDLHSHRRTTIERLNIAVVLYRNWIEEWIDTVCASSRFLSCGNLHMLWIRMVINLFHLDCANNIMVLVWCANQLFLPTDRTFFSSSLRVEFIQGPRFPNSATAVCQIPDNGTTFGQHKRTNCGSEWSSMVDIEG